MDELEGTLRGHIGLIEEALDRLEGKATEADRGKKMFVRASRWVLIRAYPALGMNIMARGRDEKTPQ